MNAIRECEHPDGCNRQHFAKGWCKTHYYRWRKDGVPGPAEIWNRKRGTCSMPGCERPHYGRGYCSPHWQRWNTSGDPGPAVLHSDVSDADRFFARVDASGGADACHPWTASTDTHGYGHFHAEGRLMIANRWLMEHLLGRRLTRDEHVLHHCDNPPCCNPGHLYIGDHFQNMQDKVERGRHHNSSVTHCPAGHEYSTDNTYTDPKGKRCCRICRRLAVRRNEAKKKAIRG